MTTRLFQIAIALCVVTMLRPPTMELFDQLAASLTAALGGG